MTLAELAKLKTVTDAASALEKHFTDMLVGAASDSHGDAVSELSKCRVLARLVRDFRAIQTGDIPASKRPPQMKPLHRFSSESSKDTPKKS